MAQEPERSEAVVKQEIMKWIERDKNIGSLVRMFTGKVRVRGGYVHGAPTGTPDYVGYCRHGIFLAVEIKRPRVGVRPEQGEEIAKILSLGGTAFVARSDTEAESQLRSACQRHEIQALYLPRPTG